MDAAFVEPVDGALVSGISQEDEYDRGLAALDAAYVEPVDKALASGVPEGYDQYDEGIAQLDEAFEASQDSNLNQ